MANAERADRGGAGGHGEVGRKRLLVIGGGVAPLDRLGAALSGLFEVVVAEPGEAAERMAEGGVSAVLAETSGFRAIERGLATSQWGAVLEAIGEAVCLCDSRGRIRWANDAFTSLGVEATARVAELCRATHGELTRLSGEGGRARGRRLQFTLGEERASYFEAMVTAVASPDGDASSPGFMVAVVRDVTALRREQQKIEALDRAGAELVRLDAEAVRRMHAHDRVEYVREKIVRLAHDLLHFDHFAIYLREGESEKLELVMSTGLKEDVSSIRLYIATEGSGHTGYVAATGRSYICHDATKDKLYIQGLGKPGSALSVPLLLNDEVIGVFTVESSEVGAFSEEDRHFAEIFARYVAMALHMLNLLVVERIATNETVQDRMEGAINEPLHDLAVEAEWLQEQAQAVGPEIAAHAARILKDVEAIRRRMREVARGPRTILGVDEELETEKKDPLLAGRRVLIADDEPQIREVIRDVLRNRGADVVVCESGGEAIEALEAGGAPFVLVVSDIKMPDRNGYEVFSAAREAHPDLPVILMTGFGYDPHHSIVRASQEGLQAVLFKPFQVEKLVEEVHKALGAAAQRGAEKS